MTLPPHQRAWIDTILVAIAAADAGPSADDLASAPVLDLWQPLVSAAGHVLLWGHVHGHPRLGTAVITTSPLVALDAAAGWARTVSRWYRVGRSFAAFKADIAEGLGATDAGPGFLSFALPGFATLNDPDLLARWLEAFVRQARRIDAADRKAGEPSNQKH